MRPVTTRSRSEAFDAALGERIRLHRMAAGLSQAGLGQQVGVSFQQLQKYESGGNRMSAFMLAKLAAVLAVSVNDLLPDTPLTDDPKYLDPRAGRPRRP